MARRTSRLSDGAVATTVGVITASAGPYLTSAPLIAAGVAALGASTGYFANVLRPIAAMELRRLDALDRKLHQDLAFSPMKSWPTLARARSDVSVRQRRWGGSPSVTQRFGISLNTLERRYAGSNCWMGMPSSTSLEALRSYGPVRVSTESIHPGVSAALLVMRNDFGIEIQQLPFPYSGVEQVEFLNAGGEVEFLIVADANMTFSGNAKTLGTYRYLFPCFRQRQFVVDKIGARAGLHRRIVVGDRSTGLEQLLYCPQSMPGRPAAHHEYLEINLLGHAVAELSAGESIVLWDPIVPLFADSYDLKIHRDRPYWFSTSIYCHKSLCFGGSSLVRDAFLECFIAAWNRACSEPRTILLRLLTDAKYWSRFCKASDGRELTHGAENQLNF